jgi:glycosyltransferase involved in cell wall biosynthesis
VVVDGKNGYLVPEDAQMVDRILELARDPDKRRRFSLDSLQRSQNLSIENTVARMEQLYGELVSTPAAVQRRARR